MQLAFQIFHFESFLISLKFISPLMTTSHVHFHVNFEFCLNFFTDKFYLKIYICRDLYSPRLVCLETKINGKRLCGCKCFKWNCQSHRDTFYFRRKKKNLIYGQLERLVILGENCKSCWRILIKLNNTHNSAVGLRLKEGKEGGFVGLKGASGFLRRMTVKMDAVTWSYLWCLLLNIWTQCRYQKKKIKC